MCEENQIMRRAEQKSVLQMEEERRSRLREDSLQQQGRVQGVLEQHKALTPYASARIERELKNGPPPELEKAEKNRWKKRMHSLLEESRRREAFFAPVNRLMDATEQRVREMQAGGREGFDESCRIVTDAQAEMAMEENQLLQDPAQLQEHPELQELHSLFRTLSLSGGSMSSEQLVALTRRYRELGDAGAAGAATAASYRHLKDAMRFPNPKAGYVLLFHCVATMLVHELDKLPAEQVNLPAFTKLYALASASGVVASQMALSREFERQNALYQTSRQQAQLDVEQQQRELSELLAARLEYLRTGVSENGAPGVWFPQNLLAEAEAYLREQGMLQSPTLSMQSFMESVNALEATVRWNRETLSTILEQQHGIHAPALRERLLEQMEQAHPRVLFRRDHRELHDALRQTMEERFDELAQYRERADYLADQSALQQFPQFLESPTVQALLGAELSDEQFREQAELLCDQITFNTEWVRSLLRDELSPAGCEPMLELLLHRCGPLFLHGAPGEIQDTVQHYLREDVMQELAPQVLEQEEAIRAAMDAAHLDPAWRTMAYRVMTPEDQPGEALSRKLEHLQETASANQEAFQQMFGAQTLSVPQWKELLQWMGEHLDQEPEEFLSQAQELAGQLTASQEKKAMTLDEYLSGGQLAQKIEQDSVGSYQSLLRGPMLCQWDGFLGYLDRREDDVMQALESVLKDETLDLPFLEDVNSLPELETLSYTEFQILASTLRGNLAETVEPWHALHGEYASEVQKALLPDMLTGALKRENFRARAQKEERRFQNEAQALEIRFLALLSGAQVQEPGELQYQHTDDTASTAVFSSKSRAARRLERFQTARRVWEVVQENGLTRAAIEKAIAVGTESGSGAKLHRQICSLLEPLADPRTKEVLREIRKGGRDSYVNEFRLGGLEEFLLSKENNEEAYQSFTAGRQEVYKQTLRTLGSEVLPRLQQVEQVISEYPSEEHEDYRTRMRPLIAGLRDGSEEENRERFGVRSWPEAVEALRQYLRRQSIVRAQKQQAGRSEADGETILEQRRDWLSQYENGKFRPLVPLLLRDKEMWQSVSTDDQVAFEAYAREVFQRVETPMTLLQLRFSLGEEFQREIISELGERMLYGPEMDLDGWMMEFNRFFDQYSRHSAGGASVEARYQKLREKNPEMANYLTEIMMNDPQGVGLLEDEETMNAAIKSCKKRVRPNTKELKNYLHGMKKTGWKPSRAEQVSLNMFLRHKLLFSEPDAFREGLSGWVQDFQTLRGQSLAQVSRSVLVMARRAEVLRDVESRTNAGVQEDRRDLEELRSLRGQLRTSGSPLLAALGVKKAPGEKQIQQARYRLWEYRELPQRVKELLFERILSGVDDETLSQEAAWLTALNRKIFSLPFYATEGERERFFAMRRVFEQMGASWRTPQRVELSDRVRSEFLLYLYVHHRGEDLTEDQLQECFQAMGERHVLMGELLEQRNAEQLDRHVRLYGAHTRVGQTAWNGSSFGDLKIRESALEAERRNITEAMAMGMYTMDDSTFRESVLRHADYLQAAESADEVFEAALGELVENEEEKQQLKAGLQDYFHAEILGGSAALNLTELRSRVEQMLRDPDYRQILQSSGSLLGSVSDTSLSGREQTAHPVANRETLEDFLAEKNNHRYCKEYNALNVQQRQVFALSVLQSDRIGGVMTLPSVTYVRSGELDQARMVFVSGQLETYVSHGDFQPEIAYDRVMEILRRPDGKMDEEAFESAMQRTRETIRRYQEQIPRDWSRLSDGAYLIREASRLARKKEAAAGQAEQPPVTALTELRERILAQDPGAAGTQALRERLASLDDYSLRIVAAALEDRTVLDPTTRMTQEESGAESRVEYVNAQKRANLIAYFLGQAEERAPLRMNSARLTRAMNGLMSYQLRDDVDLTGRRLTRSDFASKALSRKTNADWALLGRAMDFADEVLREDLRRGAGLPQEDPVALEEETQEQPSGAVEEVSVEETQSVSQETQQTEQNVQESVPVQQEQAAQEQMQEQEQEQPEEIPEEVREQRRQLLERRLDGMRNLPALAKFSTEQILSVKNMQEQLEQMDEDAFVMMAASLLQHVENNLAQLRTLLSDRGALSLLDASEAEARVIARFGGELLGRNLNSKTLEARVRAVMEPPAVSLGSFAEQNRAFIVRTRERMKQESLAYRPYTGAQTAETPEDALRMERIGQAVEALRAGVPGETEAERWLILHCSEGIADYLESATLYRKDATIEELIGWVHDTAQAVEDNRAALQRIVGKLYVFGGNAEWQEAIVNLAAKRLGADLMIERTPESRKPFVREVETIARETLDLADKPGRLLAILQRDASVKRIPDLENMPEVIACLTKDHSGDRDYSEMEELRSRVQHNVRILERVAEQMMEDADEQEEAVSRVLEQRGRLLAWRTCSSERMREMIRQAMEES